MNEKYSQCNLIESYPDNPYIVEIESKGGKRAPFIVYNFELEPNVYFIGLGIRIFKFHTVAADYIKQVGARFKDKFDVTLLIEQRSLDSISVEYKKYLISNKHFYNDSIEEAKNNILYANPSATFQVGLGLILSESLYRDAGGLDLKWIHLD